MSDPPIWALNTGVPSPHILAAAVRVASMLDHAGSELADLRRSYLQHASGAYYPEPDLTKGQALLLDCGLVRQEGTRLIPTAELLTLALEDETEASSQITLHAIATLPAETTSEELRTALDAAILSAEQREEYLLALGAKFNDSYRRLIGEVGEELVFRAAKEQLLSLGHAELAARVRRVSLGSDALGYDITAPTSTGPKRLLEVKAGLDADLARFFLSRNEWQTGTTYADDWFLVYCHVKDTAARTGEIVGWCSASELAANLPDDRGTGEWSSVRIELATPRLHFGLPH